MSQSLEQLWYTAAPVGLSGTPGWQVRAASAGLLDPRSERLQHLSNYLQYQLPPGVRPQSVRSEDMPVCLAWLDTKTERVLVCKTFIGLTWDRRPGNYFTHLVVNLPQSFTVRDAIDLWGSTFWKTADTLAPQQLELPRVTDAELIKGHLKLEDLLAPEVAECLPWLIEAFLSLLPHQRIIIVARDHTVAALIWGLTRCVPIGLLRSLTFSTYEANDTAFYTPMITGTSHVIPASAGAAFDPRAILSGPGGFVINSYTRQVSQRGFDRDVTAFASYAADRLISGDTNPLDDLVQRAEHLAVDDVQSFLFVYKFYADRSERTALEHSRSPSQSIEAFDVSRLSPNEFVRALASPQRMVALLDERPKREALPALVARDVVFWEKQVRPHLRQLVAHASADNRSALQARLRQLAVQSIFLAEAAMKARQQSHAACLIEFTTTIAPGQERQIWRILLDELSSDLHNRSGAGMYSWETRSWLFQNWYERLGPTIQHQWLEMSWSEVPLLLATDLPENWKRSALARLINEVLSNSPPCGPLREIASTYRYELLKTLKFLISWSSTHPPIVSFFSSLFRCQCERPSDLLGEMLASLGDNTESAEALLACVPLDPDEVRRLLEAHYPRILPGLTGRASATRLVAAYLDNLVVSELGPSAIAVLYAIKAEAAQTSREYITACAWLTVTEYLDRPSLHGAALTNFADAVDQLPDSCRPTIARLTLWACAGIVRTQSDLVRILTFCEATFGPYPAYYLDLFEYGIVRRIDEIPLEALHVCAQFVLEPGNQRTTQERQQTLEFLATLDRETFDSITRMTRFWSIEAHARWNTFERRHRPPPGGRHTEGLFGRMKKVLEKRNDS